MTPEDLRRASRVMLFVDASAAHIDDAEIERLAAGLRAMADAKPNAIGVACSVCGEWQRNTRSGMVCKNGHGGAPGVNKRLYTTPQRPQWVGLTEDERQAISLQVIREDSGLPWRDAMATAIDSALRAKNGGAA